MRVNFKDPLVATQERTIFVSSGDCVHIYSVDVNELSFAKKLCFNNYTVVETQFDGIFVAKKQDTKESFAMIPRSVAQDVV